MALLPAEQRSLALALNDGFRSENELSDLTLAQGLDTPLENIARPDRLPARIQEVILYFDSRGKAAILIQVAVALRPTNAALQTYGGAILKRLGEATTTLKPPPDYFEACMIEPGPQPFISRRTLRDFLRQLNTPNGFPILAVNGLSKTGKSYSFQFIGYLKRVLAAYELAWVDLSTEAHAEYKPENLAQDISLPLGWDLDTLPKRPSNRYAKELTRWVLGQWSRKQGGSPLVIVLDGFHQPELYGETRDFVQELIRQVAANTTLVRLILLNYGDALLPPGLPPIRREPLATLSRPEVVEFFSGVARQVSGAEPDKAVIEGIVDSVMNKVPLGDPAYNELLNQRVMETAQALIAPTRP
jgi:Effector-associated domain 1